MSKVAFDMPHALVTLTTIEGRVEIEVWPKTGQSAFVVVDPTAARAIADALLGMVDELSATPDDAPDGTPDATLDDAPDDIVDNIVDFASKRRPN